MEITAVGNGQLEAAPQTAEPIACVMEAILMPVGNDAGLGAPSYGSPSNKAEGGLGRGVIYLYLNGGQDPKGMAPYRIQAHHRRLSAELGSARLTATEASVLEKLAEGKSNKIIASDLFVSVNTVKTHVRSIFQKLNVNCRSAAVRKALDMGIAGCSDLQ